MRRRCVGTFFICEMLSLLLLSSFLLRARGVFVVKREGKNTVYVCLGFVCDPKFFI
jgi:hypothetical protein